MMVGLLSAASPLKVLAGFGGPNTAETIALWL
jgi:hypothetical protein